MPPRLLVDLDGIDFDRIIADRKMIREIVPQRFEMEQLDAIHYLDNEEKVAVGSRRIGDDEWWVRGHIPGRPIFPGVLAVEAAAQLSTWLYKTLTDDERFFGFGSIDEVRFRGMILPGHRLALLARLVENRSRLKLFQCQGVADGRMVFQAKVGGIVV